MPETPPIPAATEVPAVSPADMAASDAAIPAPADAAMLADAAVPAEAAAPSIDAPEPAGDAAEGEAPAPVDQTTAAADAAPAADVARVPAIAELSPAACAAALAERFPALFGAGRALPIKLRIQADIQQRAPGLFSKKSLSVFLHRHTTSTGYIKALLNSPHRFDLDGQAAGEIAQEHRDAATAELERRLALVQARRLAEREAQKQAYRQAAAAAREAQPPRPEGPPAATQGPRDAPRPPRADRLPRPDRPPRPDRADRVERADRPPRPTPTPAQPAPRADSAPGPAPQRPAPTPEQSADNEARRSRAALLRSFETSTLTRANFCALKGMRDDALELLLVKAREERKLNPPPPEREREPATREWARSDEHGPRRGPPRDGPPGRPQR